MKRNNMKLTQVKIKSLFQQYDIDWNINQSVSVLVGKNGSGKSTVLKIIYDLFKNDDEAKQELNQFAKLFDKVELVFDNTQVAYINVLEQDYDKELINLIVDIQNKKINDTSEIVRKIKKTTQKKIDLCGIDKSSIHIDLISTVFLSANSVHEIRMADGHVMGVLDLEMKSVFVDFIKVEKTLRKKCLDILQNFLKDTDKTVTLNKEHQELKFLYQQKSISYEHLSSGEKQLIYTLLKSVVSIDYANKLNKDMILLLDEPEISLHLSWQEQLLTSLYELNPNGQTIVVTHSPAIIMNGWNESYVDMDDVVVKLEGVS